MSMFEKVTRKQVLIMFVVSIVMFVLYFFLYTVVLGWELPKTKSMKLENAKLKTRMELLRMQIASCDEGLRTLEIRDEEIYRSIFGLNTIPSSVRNNGLKGFGRYSSLDSADRSGRVKDLRRRADVILKKAYVQTSSYDEIELMLKTVDNMSSSIPAICPVMLVPGKCYISSPFGYRYHPILGYGRLHRGMDFSVKPGYSVYATGDGVVEQVKIEMRGYGRQIVINHGFGYKTRYAHMKSIVVSEGMKVKRGELIGTTGNSGLSSGPHLHYEVLYRDKLVNPYHYFDNELTEEQYEKMVQQVEKGSEKFYVHPFHR